MTRENVVASLPPLAPEPEPKLEPEQKVAVLVVDDEETIRDLLRNYLTQLGLSCTVVANAHEALRAFSATPFDLVISDYRMPGLSGIDLFQELNQLHPNMLDRFILVSGTRFIPEVMDFLEQPRALFLEKPFRISHLHVQLDEALARRKVSSL